MECIAQDDLPFGGVAASGTGVTGAAILRAK